MVGNGLHNVEPLHVSRKSNHHPSVAGKGFDKTVVFRQVQQIEIYLDNSSALQKAHARFGGSQGLLRSAAQSVAESGGGDHPAGPGKSGDHEAIALKQFAFDAGLLINIEIINAVFAEVPMLGGKEHRVAFIPEEGRVIKDADVQALATESLYDYLTDLLLSNHFFDDDLQLLGCYSTGERVHIVTSQPYVNGTHPDWTQLKFGMVAQGLRAPFPNAQGGNFIIDDELLGEVDVFDLHVNNVIRDKDGWRHPIDAHFYFDDRVSRASAIHRLGLDSVFGPTALAASGLTRAKRK